MVVIKYRLLLAAVKALRGCGRIQREAAPGNMREGDGLDDGSEQPIAGRPTTDELIELAHAFLEKESNKINQ